jgi:stage V sporulation protein SpoVS
MNYYKHIGENSIMIFVSSQRHLHINSIMVAINNGDLKPLAIKRNYREPGSIYVTCTGIPCGREIHDNIQTAIKIATTRLTYKQNMLDKFISFPGEERTPSSVTRVDPATYQKQVKTPKPEIVPLLPSTQNKFGEYTRSFYKPKGGSPRRYDIISVRDKLFVVRYYNDVYGLVPGREIIELLSSSGGEAALIAYGRKIGEGTNLRAPQYVWFDYMDKHIERRDLIPNGNKLEDKFVTISAKDLIDKFETSYEDWFVNFYQPEIKAEIKEDSDTFYVAEKVFEELINKGHNSQKYTYHAKNNCRGLYKVKNSDLVTLTKSTDGQFLEKMSRCKLCCRPDGTAYVSNKPKHIAPPVVEPVIEPVVEEVIPEPVAPEIDMTKYILVEDHKAIVDALNKQHGEAMLNVKKNRLGRTLDMLDSMVVDSSIPRHDIGIIVTFLRKLGYISLNS